MSKRSKKKRKQWTASSPQWMVDGSIGKGNRQDYQEWRDRGFYKTCSPSEVRKIDPVTGIVTARNVLEEIADDILKTDRKVIKASRKRPARKASSGSGNHTPSQKDKEDFYKSWEWRRLRMQVLKLQGRTCQCCGATPSSKDMSGGNVKIVVDHIRPISRFWNLRLQRTNLQVLCDECNQGKGSWDESDYRTPPREDACSTDGVDPAILDQLTDHTTGTLQ